MLQGVREIFEMLDGDGSGGGDEVLDSEAGRIVFIGRDINSDEVSGMFRRSLERALDLNGACQDDIDDHGTSSGKGGFINRTSSSHGWLLSGSRDLLPHSDWTFDQPPPMAVTLPPKDYNLIDPIEEQHIWNSAPAWKLPAWAEPLLVLTLLLSAAWITRRRAYRVFGARSGPHKSLLDIHPDDASSSDELLHYDSDKDDDRSSGLAQERHPSKVRDCCGFTTVVTPNSSRFKNHVHSRLLQRFPFLIEMFYWVINYAFYRMTAYMADKLYKDTGIWDVAQSHGLWVLEFEQFSPLAFLFPIHEISVQRWFMHGHQDLLSVLNRVYALIHIPGTVGFIAWYYYVAPSHPTFAVVRRTMTLTNFLAFLTFIFFPTAPPRFLPKEYGFVDTVRHDDAQSVWMSGRYVNALAAMPSMHFGYSFAIGATLLYHSGILRRHLERNEVRKGLFWKVFYVLVGVGYPAMILTTIVATANHYWLDALVAIGFVMFAFASNKVFYVFIPLEDWLLWLLRVEKPVPSTGEKFHARGGRI
nr:hypothetical protein CFP56_67595 [Quercus suber]